MDAILPLGDVTNGGDSAMPARQKPEKKPKKTSWTKTHALVLMEACRFKFEMAEKKALLLLSFLGSNTLKQF